MRVFTAYPELKLSHICLPGFLVFQSQGYKECSFNIAGSFPGLSNVRISGTPSPCYQGDRPAERKSEPIWHQEDASFYLTSLQPSRDAVEVEGMVTPVANQFCANEKMEKIKTRFSHSPSHGALLTGGGGLVCLTLDAQVHDVVPEDSIHKAPGEIPEKLINTCRSHSCPQQYPTPKEPLRSIFSPNVVISA